MKNMSVGNNNNNERRNYINNNNNISNIDRSISHHIPNSNYNNNINQENLNFKISIGKDSSRMEIFSKNEKEKNENNYREKRPKSPNNKGLEAQEKNSNSDLNFNENLNYDKDNEKERNLAKQYLSHFLNKKKKRLSLSEFEGLKATFCPCIKSRNKLLGKKSKILDIYKINLNKYTDFLEILRNKREIDIMKYLLFNKEQNFSLGFLSNPNKDNYTNFSHESNEYKNILNPNYDSEKFENFINYGIGMKRKFMNNSPCLFDRKIESRKSKKNFLNQKIIDEKIWRVIDNDVKNIFNS